jgi:hypothetical protein
MDDGLVVECFLSFKSIGDNDNKRIQMPAKKSLRVSVLIEVIVAILENHGNKVWVNGLVVCLLSLLLQSSKCLWNAAQ